MNSPSAALVWEIWRKNRWGFAALILILAMCASLRFYVGHLEGHAEHLKARVGNVFEGTLPTMQVLPLSPTGLVASTVQLKLESTVIYDGAIRPDDEIAWFGVPGKPDWIRITLNGTNLFEGQRPLISPLSWVEADGSKGRMPISPASGMMMNEFTRGGGRKGWMPISPLSPVTDEIEGATATAESWRQTALGWSILMIGFSGLVVFGMFGCAEPTSLRGFTGIPPRKFTLPVSTATLVAWPMTLGAVTIVLLYIGWSRLAVNPVLPAGITVSDSYNLSLALAGLAGFQAIVWGLPSFPKTRVGLLTSLILGLVALLGMPFFLQQGARVESIAQWDALQPTLMLGFVLIWFASVVAAYFGAAKERCGAWSGWRWPAILSRPIKWLSPPSLDYLGAFHAQVWMEWRRNGRLSVAVWVLVLVVFLGVDVFTKSIDAPWTLEIEGIVSVAFVAWGALAGLNLARDGGSKELALSSFMASRPLTTGSLLAAKILAGAAIWPMAALAFVVCVVVASIVIPSEVQMLTQMLTHESTGVGIGSSFGIIVVGLALSLNVFVGILPLCLSGRIPGFPWSLLPLLMLYGLLFNAYAWFMRHAELFGWMFGLAMLALLIKLVVAFWGFRRSVRLRMISSWFVIGYLAFWLIATTVLVALALVRVQRAGWSSDVLTMLPAAALAIPLARIGVSPLALAMNRHR